MSHRSLGASKRAVDLVLSCIGLVVLSPVFLLVAVLVKLSSAGPVLFRRHVFGLHGRPFVMLKFRSMVADAHQRLMNDPKLRQQYESSLKLDRDPRITPLGAFLRRSSLDELPQLLQIVRGDMSLVGPRVLGDIELERYGPLRDRVLSVKPGLTGLWQVSGRQDTSFEHRARLDMEYIEKWSLGLDFRILIRTVGAVLGMRGAR